MADTAGDYLCDRLIGWGVSTIDGFPGDGINGILGTSPENSVVDSSQQAWAVPNLFLADGSVCPTQGSANPALTVMALSSRLAGRTASGAAIDPDPAARAGTAAGRSHRAPAGQAG